jgi:hypothetical protein
MFPTHRGVWILTCWSVPQRDFGLDIGSIDHLRIANTTNSNSPTEPHTPNITVTAVHIKFSVFSRPFLATDFNTVIITVSLNHTFPNPPPHGTGLLIQSEGWPTENIRCPAMVICESHRKHFFLYSFIYSALHSNGNYPIVACVFVVACCCRVYIATNYLARKCLRWKMFIEPLPSNGLIRHNIPT